MNNGKVSILGTEYKVTEGAGLGVTEIDGQCMNYKKNDTDQSPGRYVGTGRHGG